MTRAALLATLALSLGCVHAEASKIATSDGTTRWRIDCDDPDDCRYKADEVCPKGYEQLGSDTKHMGLEATTKIWAPVDNFAISKTEVREKVHISSIIVCGHLPTPDSPSEPTPPPPKKRKPNDDVIPSGSSWFCYAALGASDHFSSCSRTAEACEIGREHMQKTAPGKYSPCEEQPKAACFTAHNVLSDGDAAMCARTIEDCQSETRLVAAHTADWTDISICSAR